MLVSEIRGLPKVNSKSISEAYRRISQAAEQNGHLTRHVSMELERIAYIAFTVAKFREKFGTKLGRSIKQIYGVTPVHIGNSPFSIPVHISGSSMPSTHRDLGGVLTSGPKNPAAYARITGESADRQQGIVKMFEVVSFLDTPDSEPHEEKHILHMACAGPFNATLMHELAAYHNTRNPEEIASLLIDLEYYKQGILDGGAYHHLAKYSILSALFGNSLYGLSGKPKKYVDYARSEYDAVDKMFDRKRKILAMPDGKRITLDGETSGYLNRWHALLHQVIENPSEMEHIKSQIWELANGFMELRLEALQPLVSEIRAIKVAQKRTGLSDETVSHILAKSLSPEHARQVIENYGSRYAHLESA